MLALTPDEHAALLNNLEFKRSNPRFVSITNLPSDIEGYLLAHCAEQGVRTWAGQFRTCVHIPYDLLSLPPRAHNVPHADIVQSLITFLASHEADDRTELQKFLDEHRQRKNAHD